jgi:hypothetical protein|tara:strand:- start:2973 stop:3839 length:867 start_codon:yes stop_codon:yes gene_type:complete
MQFFSRNVDSSPFFDKEFLQAIKGLDSKENIFETHNLSLKNLLLKVQDDMLVPVGNRDFVDYRSLSYGKKNIVNILEDSNYQAIRIDSVKFEEIHKLSNKLFNSEMSIGIKPTDITVMLDLPASYDLYLNSLSKKNRHELKRKVKKFNNSFPQHEFIEGNRKEDFEDFILLHKNSSQDKSRFMTENVEDFFYTLFNIQGWKIYALRINKEMVSAVFCFENKEAIYLYNSGKAEDFDEFSVGIVLINYLVKKSIIDKRKLMDFLKGEERYKLTLGGRPQQLYDIELRKI